MDCQLELTYQLQTIIIVAIILIMFVYACANIYIIAIPCRTLCAYYTMVT